jgi:hypothetical protein
MSREGDAKCSTEENEEKESQKKARECRATLRLEIDPSSRDEALCDVDSQR